MPRVSARMRCAIRTASPAGVLARCCSSRIWPLRFEKTLSITSRVEASARSRPRLAAVRVLSGVSSVVPSAASRVVVVAAPEALVGDHDLGGGAGEQVGERLVLVLVGGHDRVAERQPARVGQQHEPDAPDEAVLRARVAVAGEAGELASLLAAGVVRDRELGAVGEPDAARVEPAREPLLHDRDQLDQAAQAAVVLRLLGRRQTPTALPHRSSRSRRFSTRSAQRSTARGRDRTPGGG